MNLKNGVHSMKRNFKAILLGTAFFSFCHFSLSAMEQPWDNSPLPIQQKFEKIGYMFVEDSQAQCYINSEIQLSSSEGKSALLSMMMVCPLHATEANFQELMQNENNQKLFKLSIGSQEQSQPQAETKEQKQRRKEAAYRQNNQHKIAQFELDADSLIKEAEDQIFSLINQKIAVENIQEAMNIYGESSMVVTLVFKIQSEFFNRLNNLFELLELPKNITCIEEIIKKVSEIQGENNQYSTLRHLKYWQGNQDMQGSFPHLMNAVTLIYAANPESLTTLVYSQEGACMNGLNGRAIYLALEILKKLKNDVKEAKIRFREQN